jgi:hypothetical protein
MKPKMPNAITEVCVAFFVLMACAAGLAQERTGTTGSVTFGWSSARNSVTLDQGRNNPFSIVQLDHKGIILDPNFISYEITPRYSKGLEDFYTGQKVGSGVGFTSQFLRNSPWPFWFSYNKFRNFSPGISENAKDSASNSSNLALGGSYAVSGLPKVSVQYERFKGSTNTEDIGLPFYENDGNSFLVSGDYGIKGWLLNGSVITDNDKYRQPGEIGISLLDRDSKGKLLDFSGQRDLGPNAMLRVSVSRNKREEFSDVFHGAFESQYLRSYITYHKKKIQASVQYNNTQFNNRQELQSGIAAPEDKIKVSSGERSGQSINSSLTYNIKPYLDISGDVRYAMESQYDGPNYSGGGNSFYGSPGINFRKSGTSWGVNAGYRLQYAPQSLGHSVNAGFVFGNLSVIRVAASYNWSRTWNEQGLLYGKKQQIQGGVLDFSKRAFGFMQLQVRGELQQRALDTFSQATDNVMRGFRVTLQLPRVQLSYSRRITSVDNWFYSWMRPLVAQSPSESDVASMLLGQPGDSLQPAYSDSPLRAHGQNVQLAPSQTAVGSSSPNNEISSAGTVPDLISQFSSGSRSGTILTASIAISRRMRLYGTWQKGSREEELQIANLSNSYSSDQRRVTFEWRIRQMIFEASYNLYRFDGADAQSFRKDAWVKVTRSFRLF